MNGLPPTGPTGSAVVHPDPIRTQAIELYCRELCGSDRVSAAVAHVIDSISPADAAGGDDQLLRVTRTAAARQVTPTGPRGAQAAEQRRECDLTPSLLSQSANGELPPSREFKLSNHLDRCLVCRAAQVREARASRAFSAVLLMNAPRAALPLSPPPPELAALPLSPPPPEPPVEAPTEAIVPEPIPPPAERYPTRPAAEPTPALLAPRQRRGFAVYPAGRPAPSPPRRGRRHSFANPIALLAGYAPFLVTLAVGALVLAGIALAIGGGGSGRPAAASLPPPSLSSTPPAQVGIAAVRASTTGGRAASAPASGGSATP